MSSIHAIVVDPNVAGRLVVREFAPPVPAPSEALVRVSAISLNLGEVRAAMNAEAGRRPGWDLAGFVEQPAADGSGPQKGARVVGLAASRIGGGWSELVAIPTRHLAVIPEAVTFAQASTLPVAGLTALWALEKGGLLLNRNVLITGASGGVGHLACQLARNAGANVVAVVRRAENEASVKAFGVQQVVVGEQVASAREDGPYHLILDSIGGPALASALAMLAPGGTCVSFGNSSAQETTFDVYPFFLTGGASLYGFVLFHETDRRPTSQDLGSLAHMVADGKLHPEINIEAPWTEIAEIAQRLLKRQIKGKAVLHVSDEVKGVVRKGSTV